MQYVVRPISDRTPFGGEPKHSPFTVDWSTALDILDRELWNLDAENIVLEVDVAERHIRQDGMLRADAKTSTPAVRVAFDSNQGPLVYATDVFVRPSWRRNGMQQDWQHNVYAIAKALEALRLVDRYGVIRRGEQYTGFKAIGAGRAMPPASHMTREAAGSLLYKISGLDIYKPPEEAYRRSRGVAHPDRHAGDRTLWDQVEEAGRVLGYLR